MGKPMRLNLCTVVRSALLNGGYSTVKTVNAVNGALNEIEMASNSQKTGDASMSKKARTYKVTVTESQKYEAKLSVPLLFDVWHGKIAKAEEVATFETVSIPPIFVEWLDKFAKSDVKELEAEKAQEA